MSQIAENLEDVNVEIEVQLGSTRMPVHQLLRMGRGAVIGLNVTEADDVLVLANDVPVAKAGIIVHEGRIGVTVTKLLKHPSGTGDTLSIENVAQQAVAEASPQAETPQS